MTFEDWFYDQFDRTREAAEAAWDYQQERIKLLEQRIIDLQGHDNLSYIDRKLEGE